MITYLATWCNDRTNGITLTKVGGENRLLSYHILSEAIKTDLCEKDTLKEYVKTGMYDTRKTMRRR